MEKLITECQAVKNYLLPNLLFDMIRSKFGSKIKSKLLINGTLSMEGMSYGFTN